MKGRASLSCCGGSGSGVNGGCISGDENGDGSCSGEDGGVLLSAEGSRETGGCIWGTHGDAGAK